MSGNAVQWRHPYGKPQPEEAVRHASVWLLDYPGSVIPRPGESVIATWADPGLWDALRELGLDLLNTGPLYCSGGVRGREYTPTLDGWFDRVSLELDPALGTEEEYARMVAVAAQRKASIAGDLVPLHTGTGPDFHLATRAYKDYPGMYTMVEVPRADWGLLPAVKSPWQPGHVPKPATEQLARKGYIPGLINSNDASPEAKSWSGWSATAEVVGADGKTRRWVFLHYFKPNQPALNWLDPSYARRPTVGGPADGLRDLRSILIHEIGHVMGISSGSPPLYAADDSVTVTDTGVGDDSSGSANDDTFWLFQGPSVNALMTNFDIGGTSNQAGHNARPRAGNAPVVSGAATAYGAVDTMVGTGISLDQRTIFTNKLALMLSDLGYDVVMPETFGTFYTVLNQTTGVLDIRGGRDDVDINNLAQGDSDDTITLARVGNTLVVTIGVGVDHPGTGPGMTATDQQDAFVSYFDLDDVTAITIDGRGGDDFDSDVRVDVTVTGGGPEGVADGDTLNVYWQQPKPDIKKQKTVGDPDGGTWTWTTAAGFCTRSTTTTSSW